jgi:sec-independent protein translocase protein TatC
VLNPFTEDELDEEDIGGYFYDIQFILSSLKSRLFAIFAVFTGVLGASFAGLYYGAINVIVDRLVEQVPSEEFQQSGGIPGTVPADAVLPDPSRPGYAQEAANAGSSTPTDILVALHPVEVLVFIVKFSVVLATAVTLPLVLYYAWPAIQDRGFMTEARRRTFLTWGFSLTFGLLGGSLLGLVYIAPAIIGYLITDATDAGMVISYRIKSFLWMVFFLTIGIGLFANIPVTMGLFHRGRIAPFRLQRKYWREVTLVIFIAGWLISPKGVLPMMLFSIPIVLAFMLGLLALWIVTLPNEFRDRVAKAARAALGLPRKASRLLGGRSQ